METFTDHQIIENSDYSYAETAPIFQGKYDKQPTASTPSSAAAVPSAGTALVPVTNRIALNQALADQLNGLLKKENEARVELARVASDIRRQYLKDNGTKYAPEFTAFWKEFQMEVTFGKLPQFTKYASAGDLIQRVEQQHPEYAELLPGSIKPLYALSQLKEDELPEFLASRSQEQQGKAPVSEADVKAWLKKKENPQPEQAKETFIRLAEIKIDGSYGTFGKNGSYLGKIDQPKVQELLAALREALQPYGEDVVQLVCHDEELQQRFNRKRRGRSRRLERTEAQKLKSVERWLSYCLRQQGGSKRRKKKGSADMLPFSAARTVLNVLSSCSMNHIHEYGTNEIIDTAITKPTTKEFAAALSKELLSKVGPRKFMATVCRAQKAGDWKLMKTVYIPVKKKTVVNGITTISIERERRNISEMKYNLRIAQGMLQKKLGSAVQMAEWNKQIADILNYLPESLAALPPEALAARAQEFVDRLAAEAASS